MSRNELTTDLPYQRVLETLTKRELFAAMAMQGMLTNYNGKEYFHHTLAKEAMMYADALLRALEARSE